MPHFYAKTLEHISYPAICEGFEFIFESESVFESILDSNDKNSHSLILVQHNNERFLLLKQCINDRFLIKYNKHVKVSSIEMIKSALSAYARLCNASIEYSNLSSKKPHKHTQYTNLLTIHTIETWLKNYQNGLTIEIGFGSGRHILDLAKNNPDKIFLGIEIYRPSIEQVLRQIELLELKNLFIINADCRVLFDVLPSAFVDCVYLHFPVPWDKNPTKRVFSAIFLDKCKRVLKNGSFLELRTDSKEYFDYAMSVAINFSDFCIDTNARDGIITSKYEARWLRQHKTIFNTRFYKHSNIVESQIYYDKHFISQLQPLDVNKILQSSSLKFQQEEYFLHIKNIYRYEGGFILFVLFGAYYAPNKTYLICYDNNPPTILGDIIPTNENINAIKLLMRLYGKD